MNRKARRRAAVLARKSRVKTITNTGNINSGDARIYGYGFGAGNVTITSTGAGEWRWGGSHELD